MPGSGRKAPSQRAERSRIASVSTSSTTNITIKGPLTRMPAAIAVQNIAGKVQPPGGFGRAALGKIYARQRAHGGDAGEQQHGVGLGKPRLDPEQHRAASISAASSAARRPTKASAAQ